MCPGCGKIWTALQAVWSTVYVVGGAAQLISGIFFLISIPEAYLGCNIGVGSWDIVTGIAGGILSCLGRFSPRRQEILLYLAVSILVVNCVNVIVCEWGLYFSHTLADLLKNHPNQMLIDYACFATRIATAALIIVSFLDSQFSFCSMQIAPSKAPSTTTRKKLHGSHEQVSDIEYIIPRPKSAKPQTTVYNAYSQSWVFDAETAGCSNNLETPYLKILENGTTDGCVKKLQNGLVTENSRTAHLIDNPVVHVEEASDDSTSNSDRKLCHMRSFSRSTSPVLLSASSSHVSLNQQPLHQATGPNNPPIYECLETIYRSRLNTAARKEDEEVQYQAPQQQQQTMVMRRVESVSPHVEKVQYASLMKELQRAIVSKKEPKSPTSSSSQSEKTQTDSKSSSRHESSRSDCKSSDTEFSKELEAALQLIQDLESPNTIDTPSEPKSSFCEGSNKDAGRPLAVWRNSDCSDHSEKTLSAVGSFTEIASPLTEYPPPPPLQQELSTFRPAANGKPAAAATVVIRHYPESQSTSGYSSPSHSSSSSNNPTPTWSTTSSLNGSNSNNDMSLVSNQNKLGYSIHNNNAKSTTVISLYCPANLSPRLSSHSILSQNSKSNVTLVNISGNSTPIQRSPTTATTAQNDRDNRICVETEQVSCPQTVSDTDVPSSTKQQSDKPIVMNSGWNVRSLLRKKKQSSLPKLCPELEGAIIKSESLAYLSELELLARHQRNKDIQRAIEKRVIHQLGTPRTESNC